MHTLGRSLCLYLRRRNSVRRDSYSGSRRPESGSALVLVGVFVIVLFGFAALTLDVARVYKEQRHEQFGTDAGAFAAANLLTNTTQDVVAIRNEAINIAGANGVTNTEIQNAGTVELGHWNNTNLVFTAGGATPYDAVRVPAKRIVGMTFAKVVGFGAMSPTVHSVAAVGAAGRLAGPIIPFAVTVSQLATNLFTGQPSVVGGYMTLNSDDVGSGKQGKIDLGVYEPTGSYANTGAWKADMTTAVCNCSVSTGPVPTIQGNAQVQNAIAGLGTGATFVVPVVSDISFSGNSSTADIVGFIQVQLVNYASTGNNWSAYVQYLSPVTGDQIGGGCPYQPCALARALVQ